MTRAQADARLTALNARVAVLITAFDGMAAAAKDNQLATDADKVSLLLSGIAYKIDAARYTIQIKDLNGPSDAATPAPP